MSAASWITDPGALVVARQAAEKVYRVGVCEFEDLRARICRQGREKLAATLVYTLAYLCGAVVAGAFS
jgi:hypothetical protein